MAKKKKSHRTRKQVYIKKQSEQKKPQPIKQVVKKEEVIEEKKTSPILTKFLDLVKIIKEFITNNYKILSIIPVMLVIMVVPILVRAKIVVLTEREFFNWVGLTKDLDFFNYYKAIWLIIFTSALLLITILLVIFKKIEIKKHKSFIPLLIFLFLALLSTIFALDTKVALRGFIQMSQGIFVITAYVLLIILIFQLVKDEKQIKYILLSFIVLGLVVGFIGFFQYVGKDLFNSDFFVKILFPKDLEVLKDFVKQSFSKHQIYATMGNTNFVGSFAALMVPLALGMYLYAKKPLPLLFSIGFLGLMLFIGYGSNSRAGIVGMVAGLVLILVFFRRLIIKKPLKIAIPFILILISGFVLNTITDGRVVKSLKSMNIKDALASAKEYKDNRVFITRLDAIDNKLIIETEAENLTLEWKGNGFWPYDSDGNVLEVEEKNRKITFVDERYKDYTLTIFADQIGFDANFYGKRFKVYVIDDKFTVIANGNFVTIPKTAKKVDFLDDYGRLFSGRAYIWSRSIPLLLDYPLIGAGPDNYPIAYPSDDIAGKLNFGWMNTLVDKPHNMYMQMGINFGLLGLLAFLVFVGFYAFESIKLYFKVKDFNFYYFLGITIFVSVISYLASGMFNDQRVSVAPLFYVLTGLGLAINRIIKEQNFEN